MGRLPEGTVTFLFTDIEGSTRLLQELGAAYADALLEHRALLRAAFGRHRGVEVDTAGDSFFVAFAVADDAVAAAREAQEALAGGRVHVRMGLHTGEPAVVGDGYVGMDVHRAARISAAAHGGQVVVSERTRSFLPEGLEVKDLGMHRLKDLIAPEHLYQVGPGDFPMLRTLNATNLPTQPTPLIGRTREIGEVAATLDEHRVVTLTGPGGTGKTRLAIQTAAELVEKFSDGVVWVPLATVEDPELVVPTIADILGTDRPVTEHIDGKRMLAVLDNLEQVLDAAPYVSDLVRSCPNLRLLVTSRAPLRIDGEREYAVDPLPEADAVTLFRERAFNEQTTADISEICRRVDRLPLAVELAAARTRLFTPGELLDRLDKRLPLLADGRRDAPPRHRALRDTIAWSYDLLGPDAQQTFVRLGVFVGSFDVDAAEAVADASIHDLEVLVESSLVRHADGRFSMLETIREFAVDRLELSNVATEVRNRHLAYFLALADRGSVEIYGRDAGRWVQRHVANEPNLRAAVTWALDDEAVDEALRLCAALAPVWFYRSQFGEALRWLDRALALEGGAPSLRAAALVQRGRMLLQVGRGDESLQQLRDSVELWGDIGDERGVARALASLASTTVIVEPDSARAALEVARTANLHVGDRLAESDVDFLMGVLHSNEGDLDSAATFFEQAITIARELGAAVKVEHAALNLADVELRRGNLLRASSVLHQCLVNSLELGVEWLVFGCLDTFAAVAAARGDVDRSARLWYAVDRYEESLGFQSLEIEKELYAPYRKGVPDWTGRPIDLDEAVRLALTDDSDAEPA
jgi:predicted ATPase/class 3 adenylate cyclase